MLQFREARPSESENFWIGLKAISSPLTSPVTKDQFGWIDDSPLTFDRWAADAPVDDTSREFVIYNPLQGWANLDNAGGIGDALCEIE